MGVNIYSIRNYENTPQSQGQKTKPIKANQSMSRSTGSGQALSAVEWANCDFAVGNRDFGGYTFVKTHITHEN